ncbi:unnamed protein product [Ambrosiozyma monospora]|uniref:Unnamed protein product n=1 Tax=Ambrosiozyma monospora TaxID=43982 RepID=A0A9W6YUK7_AMBMO|nr:unnamed protein product [Ambrosiozyma monospora]
MRADKWASEFIEVINKKVKDWKKSNKTASVIFNPSEAQVTVKSLFAAWENEFAAKSSVAYTIVKRSLQ